ncbi:MAG: sensor histidine kinase [Saprospiraceae bacterium]
MHLRRRNFTIVKNKTTIIAHLAFWLFYGTVVGTAGYILSEGTEGWLFIANSFLFGGLVVYGNLSFILPFLLGKKYRRFGLTAMVFITAIILLRLKTEHFFGLHMTDRYGWGAVFLLAMQMLALLVLSTLFGGFLQWLNDRERQALFQKEKLQGELKFLKTQVNPHFLFNALNNIYSLAYRQDTNTAPMIATLSKIMRYHLYDGSRERVGLKKEAEMLQDYIALQRLKHGDELRVDFYTEGIGPQHQIAPLLLINFVENSFKHGDAESNPEAWVNVSLSVEDDVLLFSVENSCQESKIRAEGLGLKNAGRLLDLAYPGRSNLSTKVENNVHSVSLTIHL